MPRFSFALKMSRKSNQDKIEQKFKEMTNIHGNKIELEKYIKIYKRCKISMDKEIYIDHGTPSQA